MIGGSLSFLQILVIHNFNLFWHELKGKEQTTQHMKFELFNYIWWDMVYLRNSTIGIIFSKTFFWLQLPSNFALELKMWHFDVVLFKSIVFYSSKAPFTFFKITWDIGFRQLIFSQFLFCQLYKSIFIKLEQLEALQASFKFLREWIYYIFCSITRRWREMNDWRNYTLRFSLQKPFHFWLYNSFTLRITFLNKEFCVD